MLDVRVWAALAAVPAGRLAGSAATAEAKHWSRLRQRRRPEGCE
jgi:hypothetical protein